MVKPVAVAPMPAPVPVAPAQINEAEKIKNFANIIQKMGSAYNMSLPCGPQVKSWMAMNSSDPDVLALMSIMNNTTPDGLSLQKKIASKGCKMALRTQTGGIIRKSRKSRKSRNT